MLNASFKPLHHSCPQFRRHSLPNMLSGFLLFVPCAFERKKRIAMLAFCTMCVRERAKGRRKNAPTLRHPASSERRTAQSEQDAFQLNPCTGREKPCVRQGPHDLLACAQNDGRCTQAMSTTASNGHGMLHSRQKGFGTWSL
eukprot:110078-Rhodomonas_salina.1